MTDRLSTINESLSRKLAARNEFDNTIQETEAAYMKVRRRLPVLGDSAAVRAARHSHYGAPHHRFLKVRKRCCTCSSGKASTWPRRSRRRRDQHRLGAVRATGDVSRLCVAVPTRESCAVVVESSSCSMVCIVVSQAKVVT